MKGDFTRNTFDPAKHYSRVLLQQGRVALDADWNEQSAITLHFLRALARDLIGPHGGPAKGIGFQIITDATDIDNLKDVDTNVKQAFKDATSRGDLVISPGHYYVDGI